MRGSYTGSRRPSRGRGIRGRGGGAGRGRGKGPGGKKTRGASSPFKPSSPASSSPSSISAPLTTTKHLNNTSSIASVPPEAPNLSLGGNRGGGRIRGRGGAVRGSLKLSGKSRVVSELSGGGPRKIFKEVEGLLSGSGGGIGGRVDRTVKAMMELIDQSSWSSLSSALEALGTLSEPLQVSVASGIVGRHSEELSLSGVCGPMVVMWAMGVLPTSPSTDAKQRKREQTLRGWAISLATDILGPQSGLRGRIVPMVASAVVDGAVVAVKGHGEVCSNHWGDGVCGLSNRLTALWGLATDAYDSLTEPSLHNAVARLLDALLCLGSPARPPWAPGGAAGQDRLASLLSASLAHAESGRGQWDESSPHGILASLLALSVAHQASRTHTGSTAAVVAASALAASPPLIPDFALRSWQVEGLLGLLEDLVRPAPREPIESVLGSSLNVLYSSLGGIVLAAGAAFHPSANVASTGGEFDASSRLEQHGVKPGALVGGEGWFGSHGALHVRREVRELWTWWALARGLTASRLKSNNGAGSATATLGRIARVFESIVSSPRAPWTQKTKELDPELEVGDLGLSLHEEDELYDDAGGRRGDFGEEDDEEEEEDEDEEGWNSEDVSNASDSEDDVDVFKDGPRDDDDDDEHHGDDGSHESGPVLSRRRRRRKPTRASTGAATGSSIGGPGVPKSRTLSPPAMPVPPRPREEPRRLGRAALMVFGALERMMAAGARGEAVTMGLPETVRKFYISNAGTCSTWVSAARFTVLCAALRIEDYSEVLSQAMSVMWSVPSGSKEWHICAVSAVVAASALGDADTVTGIAAWARRAAETSRANGETEFFSLSGTWFRAMGSAANRQYEKAVGDFAAGSERKRWGSGRGGAAELLPASADADGGAARAAALFGAEAWEVVGGSWEGLEAWLDTPATSSVLPTLYQEYLVGLATWDRGNRVEALGAARGLVDGLPGRVGDGGGYIVTRTEAALIARVRFLHLLTVVGVSGVTEEALVAAKSAEDALEGMFAGGGHDVSGLAVAHGIRVLVAATRGSNVGPLVPCRGIDGSGGDLSLWTSAARVGSVLKDLYPGSTAIAAGHRVAALEGARVARKRRAHVVATRLLDEAELTVVTDVELVPVRAERALLSRETGSRVEGLASLAAAAATVLEDSDLVASGMHVAWGNVPSAAANRPLLQMAAWFQAHPASTGTPEVLSKVTAALPPEKLEVATKELVAQLDGLHARALKASSLVHGSSVVEKLAGDALRAGVALDTGHGEAWMSLAAWCYRLAARLGSEAHEVNDEERGELSALLSTARVLSSGADELLGAVCGVLTASQGDRVETTRGSQADDFRADLEDARESEKAGTVAAKAAAAAYSSQGGTSVGKRSSPYTCAADVAVRLRAVLGGRVEDVEGAVIGAVEVWGKMRRRVSEPAVAAALGYANALRCGDDVGGEEAEDVTSGVLRLLRLLARHGVGLRPAVEALKATPPRVWSDIVPQLIARLGHGDVFVRETVADQLSAIGEVDPSLVVYAVLVASARAQGSSSVGTTAAALASIVARLRARAGPLVTGAELVIQEAGTVAQLPEEQWRTAVSELGSAAMSRAVLVAGEQGDEDGVRRKYNAVMAPIVSRVGALASGTLDEPDRGSSHSRWFRNRFGEALREGLAELKNPRDVSSEDGLTRGWKSLVATVSEMSSASKARGMLSLDDVSPRLAGVSGEDGQCSVVLPGVVKADGTSGKWGQWASVVRVEPGIAVLSTKRRPKRLTVISEDGRRHGFLLKGGEDLALDARVMQWMNVANAGLRRDARTARRGLHARTYAVVPLGGTVGLIQWVDGAPTLYRSLDQWRRETRRERGTDLWWSKLQPRLAAAGVNGATRGGDEGRKSWPMSVLKEVLGEMIEETPKDLIARGIWASSPGADVWWARSSAFCASTAVASVVGYVLGLGDRHPDNILLEAGTGEIVHIDYHACFERGRRLAVPELVPFRLTQNLVHALGATGTDGKFRSCAVDAMSVLRRAKESLLALLEAFIYDPLLEWTPVTATAGVGEVGVKAALLVCRAEGAVGGMMSDSAIARSAGDGAEGIVGLLKRVLVALVVSASGEDGQKEFELLVGAGKTYQTALKRHVGTLRRAVVGSRSGLGELVNAAESLGRSLDRTGSDDGSLLNAVKSVGATWSSVKSALTRLEGIARSMEKVLESDRAKVTGTVRQVWAQVGGGVGIGSELVRGVGRLVDGVMAVAVQAAELAELDPSGLAGGGGGGAGSGGSGSGGGAGDDSGPGDLDDIDTLESLLLSVESGLGVVMLKEAGTWLDRNSMDAESMEDGGALAGVLEGLALEGEPRSQDGLVGSGVGGGDGFEEEDRSSARTPRSGWEGGGAGVGSAPATPGTQSSGAALRRGQTRSRPAVAAVRQVKRKLDGRDVLSGAQKVDAGAQVDWLIRQATSAENLAQIYEGWLAWY